MRDIIFRGKRVDTGEWVEGQYYKRTEFYGEPSIKHYIIVSTEDLGFDQALEYHEVIPETVGQYTGLTDANGTKMFEGDILKTRRYETYAEELKGYCGYDKDGYPNKVPGYTGSMTVYRNGANDNYHAVVRFNPRRGYYAEGASVIIDAIHNIVVGNIYDNPELLVR